MITIKCDDYVMLFPMNAVCFIPKAEVTHINPSLRTPLNCGCLIAKDYGEYMQKYLKCKQKCVLFHIRWMQMNIN